VDLLVCQHQLQSNLKDVDITQQIAAIYLQPLAGCKPKPIVNRKTAHVCAYHCAQLSYTMQHQTVLIIFPRIITNIPHILHTVITAQILSITEQRIFFSYTKFNKLNDSNIFIASLESWLSTSGTSGPYGQSQAKSNQVGYI